MLRIYEKYGYFKETLVSITKKGKEGHAEIQGMLDKLRSNPPKEIGGYKVLETRDYNNNTVTKADGTVTETGLPKSNVLYFDLEDNAWCCARPSGTEPKIKFYMGVKGNSFDDADAKLEKLKNDMMAIGALDALHEARIHVPKDVSVIGCDNIFYSGIRKISLTTIDHFVALKGRDACDIILRKIDEQDRFLTDSAPVSLYNIEYTPKLIARRTTGYVRTKKNN